MAALALLAVDLTATALRGRVGSAAALTLAGTFVRAADMKLEQLGQACDTRNP